MSKIIISVIRILLTYWSFLFHVRIVGSSHKEESKLNDLIHLNDCKKISLITDLATGEIACSCCGAVISEKSVDTGNEYSGITREEYLSNARTGQKISLKMADMGLSTLIESQDRDSTGKALSSENRRVFYRLRMWDRNSRSANTKKSYQKAFILLDAIRTKLALPEPVVEETAYLFRKIISKKILSGRSTAIILCATVYIACRTTSTPRTIQDVADAGNVKRKNLQRIYRFLVKEMDIYPEVYSPIEFVTRLSNAIKTTEKTRRDALIILEKSQRNGISTSKNPMAMAAAIHISIANNQEKISQLRIAEVSGISAVTIRDRAKEIKEKLGGEI